MNVELLLKNGESKHVQIIFDLKNNVEANEEEEKILEEILAEGNGDDVAIVEDSEESELIFSAQHEMWSNLSPDTPFWEQLDKQLVSMQEQVYLI